MSDQERLAERLRTSIGRFVRATRLHADTLPPPLAESLGLLDREGDASTATLAQRRGVRHQSQSRTVKDLEALGYVERRDDPHDRRGFLLTLTAQGRAALDRDREARSDWVAQAVEAVLKPDERAQLGVLPELLDRLSDYDGGPSRAR
ncbi:DNA-binding transcriptional regulator, MarR family [Lentzea fradiae]|uniref:DNA-binding transcriptional regulator, MarR family n=1 Tax=Lentzea fradiae TaxID=200378 RepID=A0A1G7NUE1_9PSEU|nr:MarR family winged helix-turn-helix transcriptional regulator [Lentzea fradiae]SDF77553.1 DNA-binding transcriptional regulator, MarR family [Lentzea fradiae]